MLILVYIAIILAFAAIGCGFAKNEGTRYLQIAEDEYGKLCLCIKESEEVCAESALKIWEKRKTLIENYNSIKNTKEDEMTVVRVFSVAIIWALLYICIVNFHNQISVYIIIMVGIIIMAILWIKSPKVIEKNAPDYMHCKEEDFDSFLDYFQKQAETEKTYIDIVSPILIKIRKYQRTSSYLLYSSIVFGIVIPILQSF